MGSHENIYQWSDNIYYVNFFAGSKTNLSTRVLEDLTKM